jgi:hypothetical protein
MQFTAVGGPWGTAQAARTEAPVESPISAACQAIPHLLCNSCIVDERQFAGTGVSVLAILRPGEAFS